MDWQAVGSIPVSPVPTFLRDQISRLCKSADLQISVDYSHCKVSLVKKIVYLLFLLLCHSFLLSFVNHQKYIRKDVAQNK